MPTLLNNRLKNQASNFLKVECAYVIFVFSKNMTDLYEIVS